MPELPEVESLAREINREFTEQHTIKRILTNRSDLRFPLPLKEFAKLKGKHILSVGRRAKYLIFDLGDFKIVSHLGMTGGWRFSNVSKEKVHDHLAFEFMNGKFLIYNDPRRFGYVDVIKAKTNQDLTQSDWFKHLGPEPLDANLDPVFLAEMAKGSLRPIKLWLMDQQNLVGVGNIYASEILFAAQIHPIRKTKTLSLKDWTKVLLEIRRILEAAIGSGGTTLRDYRSLEGNQGAFQSHLKVYGQADRLCGICETKIKEKFLSGRSTFWCPTCQPLRVLKNAE